MPNKIRLKQLDSRAILPAYGSFGAAGADIHACIHRPIAVRPGETVLIPTGFSMELPEGYGAYLLPRSGLGHKHGIVLGNLVGLVDADYRGQVSVSIWNRNDPAFYRGDANLAEKQAYFVVNPGDRIAQMCIVETKQFEFVWADYINETERGEGGFGSTGVTAS